MTEWCESMGLHYSGLLSVIAMRDSIIENMLTAGFDPYKTSIGIQKSQYNLNEILRSSVDDGMAEIVKLKHCIFEGFKCNLLKGKGHSSYLLLLKNFQVAVSSPYLSLLGSPENKLEQNRPRYLIVSDYSLTREIGSSQFSIKSGDYVSVMDGFVDIDERFFLR